jgi:hypothetical protein
MAIIPQYRAKGPAAPLTPVMEQERGPRVDASEAVRGIARLTGAIESPTQVEQLNPELGQGVARGTQAIGQGITDVGGALFDISQRVAEAKNYHDEHQAQLALDREVGEFEKEKASLTDPMMWEPAWKARMERFSGQYFNGKNLAPATQEAIRMRTESFGVRFSNRVISEAEHKIAGDATAALMSDVLRATEAGDLLAVKDSLTRGQNLGLIDAYRATQMEFQATDSIQGKALDAAVTRADTFAMLGDETNGLRELENAPFPTNEERHNAITKFKMQVVPGIVKKEMLDRLASGEDPDDIRAALEARDEEGNYTLYPELSPSSRMAALQPIYAEINAEYSELVKRAADMIESDVIKDAQQLDEHFQGKEIDPATKAVLVKKLEGALMATEKDVVELQAAAASYDPTKDPDGRAFTAQSNIIDITLGFNNPKADDIKATLEKAKNGEPLTLPEEIFKAKWKSTSDLYDAASDHRISADRLTMEERGGKPVFVDYSVEPDEDDPARFEKETGAGWWKGTKVGRVIALDQGDTEALIKAFNTRGAKKNVYVTDLNKQADTESKKASVFTKMERGANTGKLTEDNWEEFHKKETEPIRAQVADKVVEDVFATGEDDSGDPDPSKLELPSGGSGRGSAGLFPELDLQFLESLDLGE